MAIKGKLIPAKRKFNPFNKAMMLGSGFPDFIAYKIENIEEPKEDKVNMEPPREQVSSMKVLEPSRRNVFSLPSPKTPRPPIEIPYQETKIIGVEVKSNGYLDKIEKEKCSWLINNNVFSKILIASKGEKRGTIKYVEFEEK